jgi:uncharacterized phage protein gp47/JayE
MSAAFGGGLNPADETPQGQLAVSMAAIVGFCNDAFLDLTNQVDPAFATGRMQDAIARIYFLERKPAEPTTVQATCSGAVGTIIPVGALARTANGDVYACAQQGAIGAGGSVVLPFANTVPGPTPCAPGALSTIFRAINGWETVTNVDEGVPGRNVESRDEFEERRAASVALNAAGTLPAIRAAVLNVPGVLDVYATENPTGSTVTVGGVDLDPHSLYVAAIGGSPDDVARAIWSKKAPGSAYTGNTTVTVVDDNSGYEPPFPEYDVTFTIPDPLAISFEVTLAGGPNVPSDAAQQVQQAILAAFIGSDGGSRARIGATLFASRFYCVVAALGPWVRIVEILVGTTSPTDTSVAVDIDKVPTLDVADIAVIVA